MKSQHTLDERTALAELTGLRQKLSAVRQKSLDAIRKGNYVVAGRLTNETAGLNRSIAELEAVIRSAD